MTIMYKCWVLTCTQGQYSDRTGRIVATFQHQARADRVKDGLKSILTALWRQTEDEWQLREELIEALNFDFWPDAKSLTAFDSVPPSFSIKETQFVL